MMRFTLNGEKYEFDDDKMSNLEALAIKKVTVEHWTAGELYDAFKTFDPEAVTIFVWLARRRCGENALKFSEVEFDLLEFGESFETDLPEGEPDAEPDPSEPTDEATSS